MVVKVGGCLDTGTAAVDFDSVDGIGASSVGEGISAGEFPFNFVSYVHGWPGIDLPDSNRPSA